VTRIFFCGDVMTGRAIDQVLAHPGDPRLAEPLPHGALDYVRLAEAVSGPISRPMTPQQFWGEALAELTRFDPLVRLINLETCISRAKLLAGRSVHFRMNPANVDVLSAARIDCCALANNHALDTGRRGLGQTLTTLSKAGIATAGAGPTCSQAWVPAILERAGTRFLIWSMACPDSGTPLAWGAGTRQPGIALVPDLSEQTLQAIARGVAAVRRPGDVVIFSIHWGPNWGYEVSAAQQRFARMLIDTAGVDLVHGHSSHHCKAIEVWAGKLIVYGCGDLVNDYEGIRPQGPARSDLGLLYLATLANGSARLIRLCMVPMQMKRLRLCRAPFADAQSVCTILNQQGRRFGTSARRAETGHIELLF